MHLRLALALVTSLATVPGVTAVQADQLVAVGPPGRFVSGDYDGVPCTLAAANDGTGQVMQDPATVSGVMVGGPWIVPGATRVTVACSVSSDTDFAYCPLTTFGSVGSTQCAFSIRVVGDVFLCTYVSWAYDETTVLGVPVIPPGGGAWQGDSSDPDGMPNCEQVFLTDL